jgi:hypothetical protein
MGKQLMTDQSGKPPAEKVGYGNPPLETRFKQGQSGNPKGRPKGAKGLGAELREELNEWVSITVNGKSRRIRKRRLIIKALAAEAAKGKVAAADKLLSLIIQSEGFADERPVQRTLSDTDRLILEEMLSGGVALTVAEIDQEAAPLTKGDEPGNEATATEISR